MHSASPYSHTLYQKRFSKLLNAINVPYHSPHKFSHGYAVYTIKIASDIGELKAISQNLMHSSISITDGIYGILSENDLETKISSLILKESSLNSNSVEELVMITKKLLEKIEAGKL